MPEPTPSFIVNERPAASRWRRRAPKQAYVTATLFCVGVAFHLWQAWLYGAFSPTATEVFTTAPTLLAGLLGLVLAIHPATGRAGLLCCGVIILGFALVFTAGKPLREIAIRRDIGGVAQPWAADLLRRPKAEVTTPDPLERSFTKYRDDGRFRRVKDDLVPDRLKQGLYQGAWRVEPGNGISEPCVRLVYGHGRTGITEYTIGGAGLDIANPSEKVMPGVYVDRTSPV